ncbi:MAG: hypothetical protein EXR35_11225 [Limnohabitans sp.]|nr:hypothetical protein [Limnohabitans sp.]
MITQQSLSRARPQQRHVVKPKFEGIITDLIYHDDTSPLPRPQSFLVEQDPHWVLQTHFHQEHQFQVFVAGSGTIGKNPLTKLAVHYASPHSAYGPLIAGDEGISYFTLRAVGDVGAWYIPDARKHLSTRAPKQQAHGAPSSIVDADELLKLKSVVQEEIITLNEQGLGAWLMRLPPHAKAPAPELANTGGGRFYVITLGSLISEGEEMEGLATVFATPDEDIVLQAGDKGLEVLILQYPKVAQQSFIEAMAAGKV